MIVQRQGMGWFRTVLVGLLRMGRPAPIVGTFLGRPRFLANVVFRLFLLYDVVDVVAD